MAIEFIADQCIDDLDPVFFEAVISDCLYYNARRWEGIKTQRLSLRNLPRGYGVKPLDLFHTLLRV